MLRIIQRPETDPYFNLAAEEHVLKTASANTFMAWRNEPSVIIGKHQNRSREINHEFIHAHGIPVIRRITGGGAVYQDPGNINFSFIYTDRQENLVDYRYFTRPVVDFLRKLGLNAAFEEKSNIVVDGWKVSGNSAHVHRGKVLHHGTLLFDASLDKLERSILGHEDRYQDAAVRSARKNVANIRPLLRKAMDAEAFLAAFTAFILENARETVTDPFSEAENLAIHSLAKDKYSTPAWNIGYSPASRYSHRWIANGEEFGIELYLKDGRMEKIFISGPGRHDAIFRRAEKLLTGCYHDWKTVMDLIDNTNFATAHENEFMNLLPGHLF